MLKSHVNTHAHIFYHTSIREDKWQRVKLLRKLIDLLAYTNRVCLTPRRCKENAAEPIELPFLRDGDSIPELSTRNLFDLIFFPFLAQILVHTHKSIESND